MWFFYINNKIPVIIVATIIVEKKGLFLISITMFPFKGENKSFF